MAILHTIQKLKFPADLVKKKKKNRSHLLKKSLMENLIFCVVTCDLLLNILYTPYNI